MSAPASRLAGSTDARYDVVVIGGGMAGAGVGARPRPARRLRRALRQGRLRLRHLVAVLQAHPRRPALPRAGRLRARARVARASGGRCERLAPHLVRPLPFLVPIYRGRLARAHQGAPRHVALRPAHARRRDRERYRVLRPVDALSLEPNIRAEDLRGAGYYFDDLLALPGAPVPGERALRRRVTARASSTTARWRSSCADARGLDRRAGARPPHGPGARSGAPHRRQRDGALGGRRARARRA